MFRDDGKHRKCKFNLSAGNQFFCSHSNISRESWLSVMWSAEGEHETRNTMGKNMIRNDKRDNDDGNIVDSTTMDWRANHFTIEFSILIYFFVVLLSFEGESCSVAVVKSRIEGWNGESKVVRSCVKRRRWENFNFIPISVDHHYSELILNYGFIYSRNIIFRSEPPPQLKPISTHNLLFYFFV